MASFVPRAPRAAASVGSMRGLHFAFGTAADVDSRKVIQLLCKIAASGPFCFIYAFIYALISSWKRIKYLIVSFW
jgi:hypothetical protein